MLKEFVKENIDWSKVTAFHLDEYIGISEKHPASFRKYLRKLFVQIVSPKEIHYVNGDTIDSKAECKRLGELISKQPIDVAFIGIGENGHLAFNDPPADFETEEAYLVVNLDDDCRGRQLGEGWFESMEDVPRRAISMLVKQIMKTKAIIRSVLVLRKVKEVKKSVEESVSTRIPESILQQHPNLWLYLDKDSASLLN